MDPGRHQDSLVHEHDAEKGSNGSHHEAAHGKGLNETPASSVTNVDYMHKNTPFERKLLRKVDWRLVPALGASTPFTQHVDARPTLLAAFMYGCSLIDRTNLPSVLAQY